MNKLTWILVALSLTACGSRLTPRERYVQALNQRLDGNAGASFDGMVALAHEEPDSRAGRRARATLASSGMMTSVVIVGVLAAIAIPNFIRFQARARQSEAKVQVKAGYVALESYYAEHQRYCTSFEECAWRPEPGARYLYMLTPREIAGGDHTDASPLLRMRADAALAAAGVEPRVGKDSFLLVAVGNVDSDGELDIWTIDEREVLTHVRDDVK